MLGYTTFSDEQGGNGLLHKTLAEALAARQRRDDSGERCQVYEVGDDGLLYHLPGAADVGRSLLTVRARKNDFVTVHFVPLHLQLDSNGERK